MHRRPQHLRNWLLALACLWLVSGWVSGNEKRGAISEYQVKAAFLYNFTRFTDWPARTFAAEDDPIVIGIIGKDPFGTLLDELLAGENVQGHPLTVRRLESINEATNCQVLFISHSEEGRLSALLSQLAGKPVLTVSDIDSFAHRGGMINLRLVNQSVNMEINQSAVKAADLRISSKLLRLAHIIEP